MDKYELDETNFQIALHEGLVADQEKVIAKFKSMLKTAPLDEVAGIRSAISNQKVTLNTFRCDLAKWKKAKADDVFPDHGLG